MNKIKYTALQCKVILLALFLGLAAPTTMLGNAPTELDKTIENRILSLGSSVDARYSAEVKKRVRQYTVRQRATTEVLIGRSSLYFPIFEKVLKEKGLPADLKFLSVVESGLRPSATSRSGAAGLWQFMKPTGRMMGLKINRTIDERRDIQKSTEAAADYLLQLYNRFDDWTIAIAAYNCGPGNMRKAIRKSGGKKTYWEVQKYLPRETREYVPKFIAMTYVMNYYYDHDIVPELPISELTNTSSAKVFESINLKKLSSELEIELKIIKTLNPSYVRNFIPRSEDGKYNLVLPTPEMRIVADKYHVLAALPKLIERESEKEHINFSPRPTISVVDIPAAVYVDKEEQRNRTYVKPMMIHPVRYGEEDQDLLEYKPNAYRLNDTKNGILFLNQLISNSRKNT